MRTRLAIPTTLALTGALTCAMLLPACGGGGGGGAPAIASLGGTVVGGDNQGIPGVEVLVFDENGDELTQLATTTDGATGVGIDMPVSIVFDEDMNSWTLIEAHIGLTGPGDAAVQGEVIVTTSTKAVFVPDSNLDPDTLYTLDVGTGVQDLNGNGLAAPFTSSFATSTSPSTQVEVFAVYPTTGVAGQTVEIAGLNLDEVDTVLFAGEGVTPATQNETRITFVIPELDISAGAVDLDLALVTDAAVGVPISFDLMPSIISISPTFGPALGDDAPGKTLVTIAGFNFAADGNNAQISFAGTLATIESAKGESATSSQIEVNAPEGATSGSLIVRVATGYVTAPGFFTVIPGDLPDPPSFVSSTPTNGATDISINSQIVVRVDEFVQGTSELNVTNEGAGGSSIAGTTVVTAEGDEGVLTFTPAASLPIQVNVKVSAGTGDGTVRDLFGQAIDTSTWPDGAGAFAFMTGGQFEPDPQAGINAFLNGNIHEALTIFNDIKVWPTKTQAEIDEAEFYSILIELTLLVDTEGTGTATDNLHALMEGFGWPAGGPDIFNPDAFLAPAVLPDTSPTCPEVLTYLDGDLLPALHAFLLRVQALPPSYSAPPRSFWVDSTHTISEIIEVDATDVKVLEGGMEFALFGLHFLAAYGCDLDIDELANLTVELDINTHLLNADPTLLVLEDAGDLVMSRNALRNSLTAYDAAQARLLSEVDDQCDDLIIFACNDPLEEQYAKDQVQQLALLLDKVYATTSGPHDWNVDDQTGAFVRVNGNVPYTTLDIRSLLPTFVSDSEYGVIGPVPDPDYNGLLPLWAADDAAENLFIPVPTDDLPVAQNPITCDGNISDWAAAGVTTALGTDNVAASDLSLWFDDGYYSSYYNAAVDIREYFAAEDADFIYFRMHFNAGTPDPNLDIYSLGLESDDPANTWDIDIEIWDFDDDNDFDVVMYGPGFGPVMGTVGVGSGLIEFCVPKAPLKSSAALSDGDDFILYFESLVFPPPNWPWWDVGGDETAYYRLFFNL